MDGKIKYVVKEGKTFGKDEEYKEGDVVELTSTEAASFLDKLELYDRPAKKVPEEKKQAATSPASTLKK